MMSPEVSPSPSKMPVSNDGSDGNDHPEDIGLNVDGSVMANTIGTESEESSDENEGENVGENVYSGYVALEQQPLDERNIGDGETDWVQEYQLSNDFDNQIDNYTEEDINGSESNQNDANSLSLSSQIQETPLSPNTLPIPITDAHAEVIKQAMSGFSLPLNNIPEWARVVPEENWKSKLMDSITKKH